MFQPRLAPTQNWGGEEACSPVDLKCLVGLGVNPICLPFQYVLSCYLVWRLDIIIAATLSSTVFSDVTVTLI